MRFSCFGLLFSLLIVAVAAPPTLWGQEALPRCSVVDPTEGKVGDEILVTGENIGKASVAELYFTDGKNDIKAVILDQSDTSLKTKIPAGVKPGVRYRLMVLTKGKEPRLIEQPVRVEILEE